MKKSELVAKLTAIPGDDDVVVYVGEPPTCPGALGVEIENVQLGWGAVLLMPGEQVVL